MASVLGGIVFYKHILLNYKRKQGQFSLISIKYLTTAPPGSQFYFSFLLYFFSIVLTKHVCCFGKVKLQMLQNWSTKNMTQTVHPQASFFSLNTPAYLYKQRCITFLNEYMQRKYRSPLQYIWLMLKLWEWVSLSNFNMLSSNLHQTCSR